MHFAAARNMALSKIRRKNQITDEKIELKDIDLNITNNSKEDSSIPRKFFYKKLTIRRLPYFFWLIALIFLSAGFMILYNFMAPSNSKLFMALIGEAVWEYAVLVIIFIVGFSILAVAKYETIELDKEKDSIVLSKLYLFCCKFKKIHVSMKSVDSIYPVVIVNSSGGGDSNIYKIGIRFNETHTIVFFKSLFKYFVIKDIITLRSYVFEKKFSYSSVANELRSSDFVNNH